MIRYKLIIESHQVTLVDLSSGRQVTATGASIYRKAVEFQLRCTLASLDIETLDRR